jgi:hypothetical protein
MNSQVVAFFDGSQPLGARQFWTIAALACALALVLRLPGLASRSLWLDETYSAWFASVPLRELWTEVPLYETHPPLYYTLLKAWQWLAGSSEAALRTPSVAASVATVFLVAAPARAARLGALAERVGLLAALFLALNAGSIQFAQQARPYALQTLTASVAIFFSFLLLAQMRAHAVRPSRVMLPIAGLSLAAGLTLWLHDTGIFIVVGIWTGLVLSLLLFIPGQRRQQALVVGAAALLAFLLWAPFLPTFIKQGQGVTRMDFWIRFKPRDLFSAWVLACGGKPLEIPAALLGVAAIASRWRTRQYLLCHLLAILTFAPIAMAAYSYFARPIFLPRLFAWLAPLVMALLALGVFALRPALRKPAAALVAAASILSIIRYYATPTENWREMLAALAAKAQPGDLVVALPNEVQLPIHYYRSASAMPARIVYLPAPFPAPGLARRYVGNMGAPAVDASDVARLAAVLPRYPRVWLIERHPELYDPAGLLTAELGRRHAPRQRIDGNGATIVLYAPRRPGQ